MRQDKLGSATMDGYFLVKSTIMACSVHLHSGPWQKWWKKVRTME